jgi:hypothetical protein
LITTLAKAALYNLWVSNGLCGLCKVVLQKRACKVMEDKSHLYDLLLNFNDLFLQIYLHAPCLFVKGVSTLTDIYHPSPAPTSSFSVTPVCTFATGQITAANNTCHDKGTID